MHVSNLLHIRVRKVIAKHYIVPKIVCTVASQMVSPPGIIGPI